MSNKFYTGIGSRETPSFHVGIIEATAAILAQRGYVLRSGGAAGADEAFEVGCDRVRGSKEIYLPWRMFRDNPSPLYQLTAEAFSLAEQFHPNWSGCSQAARKFMARNGYQVLGANLNTPSAFVICWTPDGKPIGGTSQAIRIAQHHQIPIINLGTETGLTALGNLLDSA